MFGYVGLTINLSNVLIITSQMIQNKVKSQIFVGEGWGMLGRRGTRRHNIPQLLPQRSDQLQTYA